jgi:hypothetical protein
MSKIFCFMSITFVFLLIGISVVLANHNPEQGPSEFNGLKFKAQDKATADEECDDGGRPKPEFVPTVRDGEPNLALLEGAIPEASTLIGDGGFCPGRHCTEYLNDGFYNNCRSWIIGTIPGWAQIDIGQVGTVNRVFLGSDHSQGFADRTPDNFDILVATETADPDSAASTWTKVFEFNDPANPVRETTEFTFDDIEARWVRIQIRGADGARIDEIEIYGGPDPLGTPTSVNPAEKLATAWGKVKRGL